MNILRTITCLYVSIQWERESMEPVGYELTTSDPLIFKISLAWI